ncbi:MAG: hypothetical protein R2752_07220 [Vicinamibacterales bacterium]
MEMFDVTTMDGAFDEVSAASAGGAPFLICFGATLAVAGLSWFVLPVEVAALVVMFQGGVALPAAFWLERRMGRARMSAANPLKALSVQLALSQMVAFPLVIVVYSLRPGGVPLAMAAIAGAHFLPYAWLQRTSIYAVLAVSVSAGAFVLQVALGALAFPAILFFLTACYWTAAPLLVRHARRLAA